jgi:hypothetical protein
LLYTQVEYFVFSSFCLFVNFELIILEFVKVNFWIETSAVRQLLLSVVIDLFIVGPGETIKTRSARLVFPIFSGSVKFLERETVSLRPA